LLQANVLPVTQLTKYQRTEGNTKHWLGIFLSSSITGLLMEQALFSLHQPFEGSTLQQARAQ